MAPDECVFCTRRDQPAPLFETRSLYVMPDKYPTVPGHVLIIPWEHLKCYALAAQEVLAELEEAAGRVREFLGEAYEKPVFMLENGIDGQSVYHAHLHFFPLDVEELPPGILAHSDVTPVEDWPAVQTCFRQHGGYRYLGIDGTRYVIAPASPLLFALRRLLADATGLKWENRGWVKTTGPRDIEELRRRWAEWVATHPCV